MNKSHQTGQVFLVVALVFFAVGMGADGSRTVTWLVLAGTFAVIGGTQLRRGSGDARSADPE